jgi:hypothetical protein
MCITSPSEHVIDEELALNNLRIYVRVIFVLVDLFILVVL